MAKRKAHDALAHLLADFQRRDDRGDLWIKAARVAVGPTELPVPGLLLFLLTEVMGLTNLGPDEKTAWHVAMGFQGHQVTIASQKFGLRMFVVPKDGSDEGPEAIAQEVLRRLRKALRIVEKEVLVEHAQEQLSEGRLTIANHSRRFRGMYEHFRAAAEVAFVASEAPAERRERAPGEGAFAGINEKLRQSQIGAWEAIAAVNAYFAVVEHELVLISAFAPEFDPTEGRLQKLIGDRWGDKFKELFGLSDPDAKRVYDGLHDIAKTYRNPYSHGFERGDAALWFHLDGIGAVPATLSDIRSSSHFELFPVQPATFGAICAELDATDRWFRERPYAAAFEWIRAGLDVAFDPESRSEYQRLLTLDRDSLGEEIEHASDMLDCLLNYEM
jgi:hypothetical protein